MIRFFLFGFFLFSYLFQLVSPAKCPTSFDCGNLGWIEFPFTTTERSDCGVLAIRGCHDSDQGANKTIRLPKMVVGALFDVIEIRPSEIKIRDNKLHDHLRIKSCEAFKNNITLPPPSPLASFEIKNNITIFRCNPTLNISRPQRFLNYSNCSDYNIFYSSQNTNISTSSAYPRSFAACSMIQLPVRDLPDSDDPFTFLAAQFCIQVRSDCDKCHPPEELRSRCQFDGEKIHCIKGIFTHTSFVQVVIYPSPTVQ